MIDSALISRILKGELSREDIADVQGERLLRDLAGQAETLMAQHFYGHAYLDLCRRHGVRPMGGGSGENDIAPIESVFAAAAAGTVNIYASIPNRPYQWRGFAWLYESAEANVDNTFDFDISHALDGATFTALFNNVNANGLLDTSAVLVLNENKGNAAGAGGAAVAVVPVEARVASGRVIRHQKVSAGTGSVPAIHLVSYGVVI